MLKLSTKGRYGTRLMIALARVYGSRTRSLRDIADSEGLSEGYLEQLIVPLRKAGLVVARRGAAGGYGLGRSPDKISLFDILNALEGGCACPDCLDEPGVCPRSGGCASRPVWVEFERRMKEIATGISLAGMLGCRGMKDGADEEIRAGQGAAVTWTP